MECRDVRDTERGWREMEVFTSLNLARSLKGKLKQRYFKATTALTVMSQQSRPGSPALEPCPGCPALAVLFNQYCAGSPGLSVLFCLNCSGCLIFAALCYLICSCCLILAFMCWQPFPGSIFVPFSVLSVPFWRSSSDCLFQLSYPACSAFVVLSQQSHQPCSECPALEVGSWQSCAACHILPILSQLSRFRLSFCGCPLSVLPRLSLPNSPVLAALSGKSYTDSLGCPVMSVLSCLSYVRARNETGSTEVRSREIRSA